jgi:hypothetical protein
MFGGNKRQKNVPAKRSAATMAERNASNAEKNIFMKTYIILNIPFFKKILKPSRH